MSFIHTISIIDSACIVIFQVVLCRQCFIAQWFNKESHNLYLHTCKYEQYKKNTGTLVLDFVFFLGITLILNILHMSFLVCLENTMMDIEDTFKHLN